MAVVPRSWAPRGYMDLNQDDFDEGTFMNMMQNLALRPREWGMKMVRPHAYPVLTLGFHL